MKKLNKIVFCVFTFMYGVLMGSYVFGFVVSPKILYDVINWLASEILFLTCIIILIISYRKDPEGDRFRYVVMIINCITYLPIVTMSGISEAFIVGLAIACFYLLYLDVKVVAIYSIWVCIVTAFNGLKMAFFNKENIADLKTGLTQTMCSMGFVGALIFSTYIAKKHNDNKIQEIKESRDKTQQLMNNIVNAVMVVNEDIRIGNELINDLDQATDNSVRIFERLADGNMDNARSIQIQTEMTHKITGLIENVVRQTKEAKNTTRLSIDGLNDSKESLNDLKKTSNDLVGVNNEVRESMNNVIATMRDVRTITEWISEISEETNLLSLNATIESAKAGKYGKGFAVVADAIRRLSDQTTRLTTDIDDIIKGLEEETLTTKELLERASSSIVDESEKIDATMDKFKAMQQDMKFLGKDMENILESTDNVVLYNNAVIEHIEQLSSEVEEVTASMEEATVMNANNRVQTRETKEIIDDLSRSIEKLLD